MPFAKEDMQHLEALARLKLPQEAAGKIAADLQAILGHVGVLEAVDVSRVAPMTHAVAQAQPLREDAAAPCLGPAGLAGSAGRDGDFVRVPRIVE